MKIFMSIRQQQKNLIPSLDFRNSSSVIVVVSQMNSRNDEDVLSPRGTVEEQSQSTKTDPRGTHVGIGLDSY